MTTTLLLSLLVVGGCSPGQVNADTVTNEPAGQNGLIVSAMTLPWNTVLRSGAAQLTGGIGSCPRLKGSGFTSGKSDLADAVRTASINKRAGGMGLISGRKAFQHPMADGVQLLNAIQDVYLSKEVTVA